ncbi:hypothetical protein HD554DRAFT_2280462, partial [Boletus coccyginus]
TSEPLLDRIDLYTSSRNTLTALIKLLEPHVPYSLHVLGTVLNAGPRASTLQDVNSSKVSLWSTIPLHSDAISTTEPPALFSIVAFSHLNHQFAVFCSGYSNTSSDLPTEAEAKHVKQVFERIREMASEARPTYDSFFTALGEQGRRAVPTRRVDGDPPMITVGGVHAKWVDVLAPMSTVQNPNDRRTTLCGVGGGGKPRMVEDLEVSQIRASDLSFIHGTSPIPRSDAYLLSRAPYSVCLRFRNGGQPVACALMHIDGSIGALRVDPRYQRRGLGRLVLRALMERLDFNKGQGDPVLVSDGHQDLGGGALGWNWADMGEHSGEPFLHVSGW